MAASNQETDRRGNNIGVLRLIFAALVVVSHSPEFLDGTRTRESLTRVFGTLSFGEVAVDAFFLVSGYLITQSFDRDPRFLPFAIRRAGRILPGYVVAFALCFFALAPFVGGGPFPLSAAGALLGVQEMLHLLPPWVSGSFSTLPYGGLNGSMWTIAYEARCYLLVAVAGSLGLSKRPAVVAIGLATLGALVLTSTGTFRGVSMEPRVERYIGQIGLGLRMTGVFGVGVLFYVLRDRIALTLRGVVVAAGALVLAMPFRALAEPAFAFFGGYLVFYTAFKAPPLPGSRLATRTDVSYGLYLYAWPIGCVLATLIPGIGPWTLCVLTLVGAIAFGTASWFLIERPALQLAHRLSRPHALAHRSAVLINQSNRPDGFAKS